ncbi:MAG: hypothetical protein LBB81_06330 [Treponema sp.]|nr:hypothetical protein [Treponema sp.]
MILSDKQAFERLQMTEERDFTSFSEVLDKACERLMDQQIKYSIRRIQAMEEKLIYLERELDEFLKTRC